MSVLQTIGTRQSTFTIDCTDDNTASRNVNIELPIGQDTSADSARSGGLDFTLDHHVSSKNVNSEAAKKHRLTSINSRLNGATKQQLNIDKPQAGTTDTNINLSVDSNTDAATKLSSSVRKRLRHINRRKTDICLLQQAEEHTGQVNDTFQHDESYSGEHSRPGVVVHDTITSGSDSACLDTSKIRKTVSFNTRPATYIDRPSVQLGENRISHKNFTKPTNDNSEPRTETDHTPTIPAAYQRSVQPTSADQSQPFLNQTAEPHIHQTFTPLHHVQIENRARDPPLSDTKPSSSDAQISGSSKTQTCHYYNTNKFTKRIKGRHVHEQDSLISDTTISNHSVKVLHGQTKRSPEVLTTESVPKKTEPNKKAISDFHASPDNNNNNNNNNNNRGSAEKIHSHRSNQETTRTPVLVRASHVAKRDVQASGLILSRDSDETEQRVVCALLDESSPPKPQSTAAFIPWEHGCDGDQVLLENNEPSESNSQKHHRQTKHNNDQRFVAESVENTPRRGVQQTQVVHSKMARSGKFDYANESFEDVLTERNDMAKTERVYRMRIRQLEEELKQMVGQCQGLSNENKELRKTLDGMKATKEKSDNVDVLSKLAKLESEKAKLAAEYSKTLKQMDSVMTDSAKIKTVNAELENTVKELQQQLKSLNAQIKSHESETTRRMESQIRDLQSTIKHLEHEKKAVEAKVKSLEYDNTSLTDSLDSKRREIDDLTNSLHARTVTEANLRVLQNENHHLKQDLTEMNKKLRDLEAGKQNLQDLLSEQDKTFQQLKTDSDDKDKTISRLRTDSEVNMQEIKKLNESQQTSRDKERESLVSRIASLKAEIDSSLSENYKLKQEREEMVKITEKLRQDNLNAIESGKESKKYLRKWEQEKEHRSKVEDDLDKKKEEALMLEIRVREAENTVSFLQKRVKSLEHEPDDVNNSTTTNPETNNKVLRDRNMKLRQMLVERNIELTNTKHEQTITDSRIQHLERKQKSSEVQVKQLAEYLGSVVYNGDQESSSEATKVVLISSSKKSPPSQPHKNSSPLQPHKKHVKSPRKATELSTKECDKIAGNEGEHTTSSLPLLQRSSASGPPSRNGYFTLYREKRKRVKDKGYM